MKTCNTCKQTLPLERFNKDSSKHDNLCLYCKACVKVRNDKFYEAHPNDRREYYLANKLRIQERNEAWQKANADKMNKYYAEYRRVNKDLIAQKKKAKKNEAATLSNNR